MLTDRERDVLRLLPSRLTLNEIAGELFVSVNTVKFHLRVVYRKLGVNGREAAADVARSNVQVGAHHGPLTSTREARAAAPPAFGWWPPTPDRRTLACGAAAPTIVQRTQRDTVVDLRESDSVPDTSPTDDSGPDDSAPAVSTAAVARRAPSVPRRR